MTEFFYKGSLKFLADLKIDLVHHQIELKPNWDIDHICYRVDSIARYEEVKKDFLLFSSLLAESEVNGRPISTFKLAKPIIYENWLIDTVELPAPKAGKLIAEGFEHVEVVVDVPFNQLTEKYKHLRLDQGGLKKNFNQELEIVLGPRNIKFHHLSLASVITLEENKKVFSALNKSGLLSDFKSYNPLVAGTYPLGLATPGSDLDILMCAEDIVKVEMLLKQKFSQENKFSARRSVVDGLETLLVNFEREGVPFEIFVQNRPTVYQQAYRHFLIEERLLKLGEPKLLVKIRNARLKQIKTETAFAGALGLTGDPYQALLNLQNYSLSELKKLL